MPVDEAILTQTLLSTSRLFCERGYRTLFRDLEFSLLAGEVVRIAGPNGAGKSTLLKVLSGISTDYEGDIFWREQPIDTCRDDFLRHTCFLGHAKAVKKNLTPAENLRWFQSLYPCKASVSISAALEHVGLAAYEDTLCGQLSAGQQQRVALARLVMSDACLWILDEPFTAIDKDGVKAFEAMIGEFASLGGSVLITTHHDLNLSVPVRVVELGHG